MKPIKDFLRTDTDTPVWSKLGRGLGKGEEKYEYSLELTLSLVPIYCWLATLSPEVSQYILVYRLEPQVQILFVQANFARIVQEKLLFELEAFLVERLWHSEINRNLKIWSAPNQLNLLRFVRTMRPVLFLHFFFQIDIINYFVWKQTLQSY